MKIQWFGNNILEISSFIGQDISRLLISGQLFIPTTKGISTVPIGAYIRKNEDGTYDIVE